MVFLFLLVFFGFLEVFLVFYFLSPKTSGILFFFVFFVFFGFLEVFLVFYFLSPKTSGILVFSSYFCFLLSRPKDLWKVVSVSVF